MRNKENDLKFDKRGTLPIPLIVVFATDEAFQTGRPLFLWCQLYAEVHSGKVSYEPNLDSIGRFPMNYSGGGGGQRALTIGGRQEFHVAEGEKFVMVPKLRCAICLDEFVENPEWEGWKGFMTECGHKFHKECLRRWFRKGGRGCAVCRTLIGAPW
jgi:hypothetical protein